MEPLRLRTDWYFEAPIEAVWNVLHDVDRWPQWWPYVQEVVPLVEGDADGVGALRRYTWTSRLPYRLRFEMRLTRVERPRLMEGEACGELEGRGRWTLRGDGRGTAVRYDWCVLPTRPWMRRLTPLVRPLYAWNHDAVMRAGGEGLAQRLGVRLLTP